jgi:hypothetical protein
MEIASQVFVTWVAYLYTVSLSRFLYFGSYSTPLRRLPIGETIQTLRSAIGSFHHSPVCDADGGIDFPVASIVYSPGPLV